MDDKAKAECMEFLRYVGDDAVPEGVTASPECEGREFCSVEEDCGKCRYDYMAKKGWLRGEEDGKQ